MTVSTPRSPSNHSSEPLSGAFDESFQSAKTLAEPAPGVMSGKVKLYDYTEARQIMLSLVRPFPTIPCVFVGWDSTPRRGTKRADWSEQFAAGIWQCTRSRDYETPDKQ
jgi:hypothetical protein